METRDIVSGRTYLGQGQGKRRVESVFGRGRNRQVKYRVVAGADELPGALGFARILHFAGWAERVLPDECPGHERGGTAEPCCTRAGEYNGFGSDGPLLFRCPKGCGCHD